MDTTVIWDDEPGQNVDHIAEHGLTPEEVDEVLLDDSIPTAQSLFHKRWTDLASPQRQARASGESRGNRAARPCLPLRARGTGNPSGTDSHSNTTGRPCKFGYTSTGKYIIVHWDELCDNPRMIYPVTAY